MHWQPKSWAGNGDCVVVEDAPNGVEAAEAAGCSCIGITSSFPAEELSVKGADIVVPVLRISAILWFLLYRAGMVWSGAPAQRLQAGDCCAGACLYSLFRV